MNPLIGSDLDPLIFFFMKLESRNKVLKIIYHVSITRGCPINHRIKQKLIPTIQMGKLQKENAILNSDPFNCFIFMTGEKKREKKDK
jgi:hypothetical protein